MLDTSAAVSWNIICIIDSTCIQMEEITKPNKQIHQKHSQASIVETIHLENFIYFYLT